MNPSRGSGGSVTRRGFILHGEIMLIPIDEIPPDAEVVPPTTVTSGVAQSPHASEGAILERASRLVVIAYLAAELQLRRVNQWKPSDDPFVMQPWWDLQCLFTALTRVRRCGLIARQVASAQKAIDKALADFDRNTVGLKTMRDVVEHFDAYALDAANRHNRSLSRFDLEVAQFDGSSVKWLNEQIDCVAAVEAAKRVMLEVIRAKRSLGASVRGLSTMLEETTQ